MDSVMMTTPSNTSKLRARIRSAANALCARTVRKSQKQTVKKQTNCPVVAVPNRQPVQKTNSGRQSVHVGKPKSGFLCSKSNKKFPEKYLHIAVDSGRSSDNSDNTKPSIVRDALSAWSPIAAGHSAPPERLQALFHELQLFPSRKQVHEMLHTARLCSRGYSRPPCATIPLTPLTPCSPVNLSTQSPPASPTTPPSSPLQRSPSRSSGRRTLSPLTLTFAEFCVFASEMKRCSALRESIKRSSVEESKNKKNFANRTNVNTSTPNNINVHIKIQQNLMYQQQLLQNNANANMTIKSKSPNNLNISHKHNNVSNAKDVSPLNSMKNGNGKNYSVFLGGSCNPTTWRRDIAIPVLENSGISYYNPQVSHWSPELIDIEHHAKESARVLFFVIDNETRSTAGAVEAAHIAGGNRDLVLVIHPYRTNQCILGEPLSPQEYLDLSRNQQILQELVERRGLPVLSTIQAGLRRTRAIIHSESSARAPAISVHRKLLKLRNAFDRADVTNRKYLNLQQCLQALSYLGIKVSIAELTSTAEALTDIISASLSNSTQNPIVLNATQETHSNNATIMLDFQQFCGIAAELSLTQGICEKQLQSLPTTTNVNDNANHFDWVNNQTLQRQCSSNNNTTDNCRLNITNGQSDSDILTNGSTNLSYKQKPSNLTIQSNINYVKEDTNSTRNTVLEELHDNIGCNVRGNEIDMRDLYLGGSCMLRTKWRQSLIIPMLQERGITYHNPRLHESLIKVKRNESILNCTFGCHESFYQSDSEIREINRPEKRAKYHEGTETTITNGKHYNQNGQHDVKTKYLRTAIKDNITLNLQHIVRNSSESSIESGSSSDSSPSTPNFETNSSNFVLSTPPSPTVEEPSAETVIPPFCGLYNPSLIANSRVLLFVITNETRSLAPMTLAAHCIGQGMKVVLCVQMLAEGTTVGNDKLTAIAIKDYNRGRAYLADLATREGVPVYDDILKATERAILMLQDE